jgi:hypothetical protein
MRLHCFSSPSVLSCYPIWSAYRPIPSSVGSVVQVINHPSPSHIMTTDIDMNTYTSQSWPSPSKATRPTPLLSSSLFTPPKSQLRPIEKHADIFSPRPETPSPPQFPFLDSPTPKSIKERNNATPSPPTPPRPRRRHALSDTTNANPRHKMCGKSSFELALAAFPAPPARSPSMPLFRSLPASHTMRAPQTKKSPLARKEVVDSDSGSESDCRTITGIPATPSMANSGWDNFWSEVSQPMNWASLQGS